MAQRLPLTFDGCAGLLHQAGGNLGVVVVAPPGFEDLCSHRALDMLAQMLADAGLPTLRFDLPGSGDSLGDEDDARLADQWIASVSNAIDELRRVTDVERVALVGLRVGALLAAEVASRWGDVAKLVLLAPPSSGKAYVRELKVLSRVIAPLPPTPPDLAEEPYDGVELAGFRLSRESAEGLQRLSWPDTAPGEDILVFTQRGADFGATIARWEAPAVAIARADFDGYEKMMCDPTATVTPLATLRAVADHLAAGVETRASKASSPRATVLHGGEWIEEHVSFGEGFELNGVFCKPANASADEVVILTNAGGIRRIGWGRQHVAFARELAMAGVATFRFDLSHIAEATGPDPATPFHYGENIHAEIGAAIDMLEARGFEKVTLLGACSGAYHCLRATVADPRVTRLVSINQLCFEWGPNYSFPLNAWMMQKASDVERRRNAEDEGLSDLARLRARLMSRAIKLAKTSAKSAYYAVRAIANRNAGDEAETKSNGPEKAFADIAARGARIDLVYAEGDDGLVELERWFGPNGERALAKPGVTKTTLAAADHLLTARHARAGLLAILRGRESEVDANAQTRAA
jgi:pimeloyl-ACP methyl ester carboxylesterase